MSFHWLSDPRCIPVLSLQARHAPELLAPPSSQRRVLSDTGCRIGAEARLEAQGRTREWEERVGLWSEFEFSICPA